MRGAAWTALRHSAPFMVRRALERLREGLYDPFAVRLLTARHDELDARVDADLKRLEAGEAVHLCVCGPYGQGKSHTLTYLRERSLEQGYVVSAIHLDPREAPMHQFRHVYRALLEALTFPAAPATTDAIAALVSAWQAWASAQASETDEDDPSLTLARRIPADMPHPFKATLVALAQTTRHVPPGMRVLKRYRDYRPSDFPMILRRALSGESVPVARLRPALKYRQVSFYRQASLALNGDDAYLQMIASLAQLLRLMGYKGWLLLFDEGEAMVQVRTPLRARAYRNLHRLLFPAVSNPGFYPVFGFTPDFFQRLREEDYDLPYFERHYDAAWREVSVYHLPGLSKADWQALCEKLIALHRVAYDWPADREQLLPMLTERLDSLPLEDTRLTLKSLVDDLDSVQQALHFEVAGL